MRKNYYISPESTEVLAEMQGLLCGSDEENSAGIFSENDFTLL